jgi:GMP synthase (glutamine-hydrolysing)
MGGPMGVYEGEKHAFLPREIDFIEKAVSRGVPTLGVCLGAQLLARALGSPVYPHRFREIGWYPLRLTPEGRKDPAFRRWPPRARVFQWHGDTFDLPQGAALLARSPLCENQAFRHGRTAYGLQFHLEVTPAMIGEWLAQPGTARELAAPEAQSAPAIRRGAGRYGPALERLGNIFFGEFARLFSRSAP